MSTSTELPPGVPEGFIRVATLKSPRRIRPAYIPIAREFMAEGTIAEWKSLRYILFHATFSEPDEGAMEAQLVNAHHCIPAHSARQQLSGQPGWDQIKRSFISYPKIIRIHDGISATYKIVPSEVVSSDDLERFLPPPAGKRYLYCTRVGSSYGHRPLDKWEISHGKLDRIAPHVEQLPELGLDQAPASLIVYVVDEAASYLAVDLRKPSNLDTLDPRTLAQRSLTSRSGAAMHTLVLPLRDEEADPDSVASVFEAYNRATDGPEVTRTFARRSNHEGGPISHVVHVETTSPELWQTFEQATSSSLRRCCVQMADHIRQEILLLTTTRDVGQMEKENSFYDFIVRQTQSTDTKAVVRMDAVGRVEVDVYWLVGAQGTDVPYLRAVKHTFWSPTVFFSTKEVIRQFENHALKHIPIWHTQRDKFSNITMGIPSTLENVVCYTHVPPPSDPGTYHTAVAAVEEMDFLYPFQKKTVQDMVARETAQDGFMGLFCSRISGPPNQGGVFAVADPYTPTSTTTNVFVYVESPALFMRCGGILADQVGMGKTRQVVALIRALPKVYATLIVVKPNVLAQWQDEIHSVWPECKVCVFHGARKKNIDVGRAVLEHHVVITTYSTVMSCTEQLVNSGLWGRIVTDESHDISPRFSKLFRYFAGPVWCVTATPEKRLRPIMRWLLGDTTRVITGDASRYGRFSWDVWNYKLHGAAVLRVVMLRKTRDIHLDLPEPVEHNVTIDLGPDEKRQYDSTQNRVTANRRRLTQLQMQQRVLQLSTIASFGTYHTEAIRNTFGEAPEMREFVIGDPGDPPDDDVCPICIDSFTEPCRTACRHWFCTECLQLHITRTSVTACPLCRTRIPPRSVVKRKREEDQEDEGDMSNGTPGKKLERMLRDIARILSEPGHKILVFFPTVSSLTSFQRLVEDSLGVEALVVHGGVPLRRRQKHFQRFQTCEQDRLLLATTKTMSDGISLTAASHILLLSPTGNNAVDKQILGRANRIGRRLDVPVTFSRYIASGTIEEEVFKHQKTHGHVLYNQLLVGV